MKNMMSKEQQNFSDLLRELIMVIQYCSLVG